MHSLIVKILRDVCVSSAANAVTVAVLSVTCRLIYERARRRKLQCRSLSAADLINAAEAEQQDSGDRARNETRRTTRSVSTSHHLRSLENCV